MVVELRVVPRDRAMVMIFRSPKAWKITRTPTKQEFIVFLALILCFTLVIWYMLHRKYRVK